MPVRSSLTLLPRASARPLSARSGRSVTMRPSTTLTAPPIAPLPNSSVAGPFSTSIWSARKGSTLTAWSALTVDTSSVASPPERICTRGPSWPRMIGRLTPTPKSPPCTPATPDSVCPSVAPLLRSSASPASTSTGAAMSSAEVRIGVAVTVIWSNSRADCEGASAARAAEGRAARRAIAAASGARRMGKGDMGAPSGVAERNVIK